MNSDRRRVVVTGMGLVSPLGSELETLWSALVAGKSGAGRITAFDPSEFKVQIAAQVNDFEPADFLGHQDLRRTDRCTQFALVAALKAIQHAGLTINAENARRVGVLVGSGQGGFQTMETQAKVLFEKGPNRVSPMTVPMMIANMASGYISILTGAKGPNSTVITACATGSHAIGDATEVIRRGAADVMIAGGTEAAITPLSIAAFGNSGAMCKTYNDDPERASRPFDGKRAGFVMGEGAGVLILESLEHAQARGATILGEVMGYGMTADAYHMTSPDPSGEGVGTAMIEAMQDADLQPDQIGHINAHATSTGLGDLAESKGIEFAFGEIGRRIPVSATKGATGHLLGAAGAVEAIISLLAVAKKQAPPTINQEFEDDEIKIDIVRNAPRTIDASYVMSNNLGFGGHNSVLIFGAFL